MSPAVSLCVPTYNRAGRLAESLPALIEAVRRHDRRDDFEICVSDNASPDGTAEVIGRCGPAAGPVRFRRDRQERNLGFAGNFAAVAALATGNCFVILADDDELLPSALDALLDGAGRVGPDRPLALFDSLPGGDAVTRGLYRPTAETVIDGPGELLGRLGIFHASFVSNLLFHRETALARLQPEFLKSRYPHTALALALLREKPAVFLPGRLVRVELPPDAGDQPLLTSVDMARVMTEYALGDCRCRGLAGPVYRFLLRMLPTAVYQKRTGRCVGDDGNPYASLRLGNVLACYRRSLVHQAAAAMLWFAARLLPLPALRGVLRRVSRHPR